MNYQIKKISDNVLGFITQNKIKGNVYLIIGLYGHILIDTGWSGTYKEIFDKIISLNIKLDQIKNILLTHGDGDHVGNVKYFAERLDVKVYSSKETAKLLALPKSPKHYLFPLNFFVKLGFIIQIKRYSVDSIIDEGILYFNKMEVQVLNTPGHCNGHLSFYLPKQKILFVGDVLNNFGKLAVSHNYLNFDSEKALNSARKLLCIKPSFICPGHGDVWVAERNQNEIDILIKRIDKSLIKKDQKFSIKSQTMF